MKRSILILTAMAMLCPPTNAQMRGQRIPEARGEIRTHEINPNSRRNQIIVSLVNQYGTIGSDSLMVMAAVPRDKQGRPSLPIEVEPLFAVAPSPKEQKTADVLFTFNVGPISTESLADTLVFVVSSRLGPFIVKSAVLHLQKPRLPEGMSVPAFNSSKVIREEIVLERRK